MSDSASRLAHLLRSRLKIKQLAALCAFSEHGSLHKAAAAQGMSQPAMSKVLKEIENTIGAALFERNHSGLHTTPLGERVIFRARSILADLDQLAVELDVMKEGDRASLRIGIIPLLSFSLVANVIEKLSQKKRKVQFQHCCWVNRSSRRLPEISQPRLRACPPARKDGNGGSRFTRAVFTKILPGNELKERI